MLKGKPQCPVCKSHYVIMVLTETNDNYEYRCKNCDCLFNSKEREEKLKHYVKQN